MDVAGPTVYVVVPTVVCVPSLTSSRAVWVPTGTEGALRLAVKSKGRIVFIDPADILAVQAEGNYVLFLREGGSHFLRESISTIAKEMEPYGFIRIHRSVLVNASYVEEIHPWPTGEYGIRLKGGKEFTVTRTYKKNLKSLATLWVGTDRFLDSIQQ